jgi:hypothetical protein
MIEGLLAGRVSGRPLNPEAEMFKNMAYYLRIGNEVDYFHLSSAARTRKGVRLIDLFDTFTPAL